MSISSDSPFLLQRVKKKKQKSSVGSECCVWNLEAHCLFQIPHPSQHQSPPGYYELKPRQLIRCLVTHFDNAEEKLFEWDNNIPAFNFLLHSPFQPMLSTTLVELPGHPNRQSLLSGISALVHLHNLEYKQTLYACERPGLSLKREELKRQR